MVRAGSGRWRGRRILRGLRPTCGRESHNNDEVISVSLRIYLIPSNYRRTYLQWQWIGRWLSSNYKNDQKQYIDKTDMQKKSKQTSAFPYISMRAAASFFQSFFFPSFHYLARAVPAIFPDLKSFQFKSHQGGPMLQVWHCVTLRFVEAKVGFILPH